MPKGVRNIKEPTAFKDFSSMARCLRECDLKAIGRKPGSTMVVETPMSHDFRKVISVQVKGRMLWADRLTGSLYDSGTGECLTSQSIRLLLETEDKPYDTLKKKFPRLQKQYIEPRVRPGPKPNTPPAWGHPAQLET